MVHLDEQTIQRIHAAIEGKIVLVIPPVEDEYPEFYAEIIKHKQNGYYEVKKVNTDNVFSVHSDFMDFTKLFAAVNLIHDEDTSEVTFELKS